MTLPAVPHEVPGHVQLQNHVRNQVQVQGGTNWDWSRSAVATPISQVKDPEPIVVVQPKTPFQVAMEAPASATMNFRANSATLSGAAVKEVSKLNRKGSYLVVGYAQASEKNAEGLSLKRAEAVARHLRQRGATVEVVARGAVGEGSRTVEVRPY